MNISYDVWAFDYNAEKPCLTMKKNESIEKVDIYKSINLARSYREEGNHDLAIKEFQRIFSGILPEENPALYNKILNEIELTQKKTILESKPRRLGVTLTTRCNLRCIMCKIRETPWDIPKKTAKEIIEYFPYLRYIMWLGGEVFLSEHFEELYDKAAMYPYLKQAIFTSGILINERLAKKLVNANTMLSYSIDGFTKETYEFIREGAAFKELLESIETINRYKKKYNSDSRNLAKYITGINFTVMKSNYREIEKAVDFAKEYEFDLLTINAIDGVEGPENIFLHNDLEAAAYIEKVMPIVIHKARSYGITLNFWLPHNTRSLVQGESFCGQEEKKSDGGLVCYLPWQHLFIDPGGKVRPHCLCKEEIGDIGKSSLAQIWNGETMQLYRQKLLNNDCKNWCNARCAAGIITKEELRRDD